MSPESPVTDEAADNDAADREAALHLLLSEAAPDDQVMHLLRLVEEATECLPAPAGAGRKAPVAA